MSGVLRVDEVHVVHRDRNRLLRVLEQFDLHFFGSERKGDRDAAGLRGRSDVVGHLAVGRHFVFVII
jgi:hypothetical protein